MHTRQAFAFDALASEIMDHNHLNWKTMDPSLHGCRLCDPIFHDKFAKAESSVDRNFQKMLQFEKGKFGGIFVIHRKVSHWYKHLQSTCSMVKAREFGAISKMQHGRCIIQELNHITQKRFVNGDLFWLSDLRQSKLLMLHRVSRKTLFF